MCLRVLQEFGILKATHLILCLKNTKLDSKALFFSLHHMVSKNSGHILWELLDPFCVACFRWAATEAFEFLISTCGFTAASGASHLKGATVGHWQAQKVAGPSQNPHKPEQWHQLEEKWNLCFRRRNLKYNTIQHNDTALNSLHFPWFSYKPINIMQEISRNTL